LPVTCRSDDWVVIAENHTASGFGFQLVRDHRPPQWPDPARPQQFHFDVMVDDLAAAEPKVLALGAGAFRRATRSTRTQPVIPSA